MGIRHREREREREGENTKAKMLFHDKAYALSLYEGERSEREMRKRESTSFILTGTEASAVCCKCSLQNSLL
jgi:hypothetical protein